MSTESYSSARAPVVSCTRKVRRSCRGASMGRSLQVVVVYHAQCLLKSWPISRSIDQRLRNLSRPAFGFGLSHQNSVDGANPFPLRRPLLHTCRASLMASQQLYRAKRSMLIPCHIKQVRDAGVATRLCRRLGMVPSAPRRDQALGRVR